MKPHQSPRAPRRDVSESRKAMYYGGMGVMVLGLILFLSVFLRAFSGHIGGPSDMAAAPVGIVLIGIGGALRSVGQRGLAGSGVILDPQRAREDLEPWARTAGGLVKDAVHEAGLSGAAGAGSAARGDGWSELPLDERIRRLASLRDDGLLSDEEFEREKRELLDAH